MQSIYKIDIDCDVLILAIRYIIKLILFIFVVIYSRAFHHSRDAI